MVAKRFFDIVFSFVALLVFAPLLLSGIIIAAVDTCSSGIFLQQRIGQWGRPFTMYKLKTIHPQTHKISSCGRFLRRYKIDELPQLLNVLSGSMSVVGPRPDVKGYYDRLTGDYQKILALKPGITSLAALKYRDEETVLAAQKDPLKYNDEVLFPDKVKMNLDYYKQRNFLLDLKIILKTIVLIARKNNNNSTKNQ
jgi:lipopolysaccharide/colanic/teichoic acid biosynthesis glycosyltransferase